MKRVLLEVLDITPTTVCRRLDRAAEGCDKVNENLMKDVNVSKIEMDEIWVIVQKIVPRMENYEDDGPWMWAASAPSCRLIVAFSIGPRKQYVADELVESTAKRLAGSKPLFVPDGLEFYAKAILKEFREIEEFPRTGKRGRPKKPKFVLRMT